MKQKLLAIVPLGDCGAYVEFSRTLDVETNAFVQKLGLAVEAAARKTGLSALRDLVPAFGGLLSLTEQSVVKEAKSKNRRITIEDKIVSRPKEGAP